MQGQRAWEVKDILTEGEKGFKSLELSGGWENLSATKYLMAQLILSLFGQKKGKKKHQDGWVVMEGRLSSEQVVSQALAGSETKTNERGPRTGRGRGWLIHTETCAEKVGS